MLFFSPQVTNKQQCYVYKSTLEDIVTDDNNDINLNNQNEKISAPNF